ncbi:MAG TPA: hypothetical protein VK631_02230 [Solirubrobacteraceae bacterium]|nr:hypothetical protein [Solirubrobacteraceae bacterium]
MSRARSLLLGAALLAAAVALPQPAWAQAAEPEWRLEHPAVPGTPFPRPLGRPAALELLSSSRGLLMTEGTERVRKGLWTWDGAEWAPLSDVCGADAERGAIAWVSASEFWTVSDPAPNPFTPPPAYQIGERRDEGTTLCRFKDGVVERSLAAPATGPNRWSQMTSAACVTANDCFFGGHGMLSDEDQPLGTFHVRVRDGEPSVIWGDQQRGVSDLAVHRGKLVESVVSGMRPVHRGERAVPAEPEGAAARLLHEWDGRRFANDPFEPGPWPLELRSGTRRAYVGGNFATPWAPNQEPPMLDADLYALDSDGEELWAVGGGAYSGSWGIGDPYPNSNQCNGREPFQGYRAPRPPLAAVREGDGPFRELRLSEADAVALLGLDSSSYAWPSVNQFTAFGDVAAIPGRPREAWVTLLSTVGHPCFYDAGMEREAEDTWLRDEAPELMRVRYDPAAPAGAANLEVLERLTLPDGARRGGVRRIDCSAATECWAVTEQGWLYHWTDGAPLERDMGSPFRTLITQRPQDARSIDIPDTPPVDDSELFKPQPIVVDAPEPHAPPVVVEPEVQQSPRRTALVARSTVRNRGRRLLELRFRLARPARVGVSGELHGRVVARTKARRLEPGDQLLRMRVRERWRPGKLRLSTRELAPDAPTLRASAARSGTRLRTRVTAPGAGMLTVVARTASGQALARTRTRLAAAGPMPAKLRLPPRGRRTEVVVTFAYAGARGVAPRRLGYVRRLPAPRQGKRG